MKIKSFAPVADQNARVLVLGSMPGPESLRQNQYYAYPANSFWRIVFSLWGQNAPADYVLRTEFLRQKRIALWDTLARCARKGAGDSQIKQADLNDIAGFLALHPQVEAVFCNGRASYNYFMRGFGRTLNVKCHYLPSTSPAYAAMSYEKKFESWKVLKQTLEGTS